MNRASPFRPLSSRQHELLDAWLADYIGAPHPRLGRSGAVCPFVAPARRANFLTLVRCDWTAGSDTARLVELLQAAMDHFDALLTVSANPALESLIVVFDGMRREEWILVDEAHRAAKDTAVSRGLMLGQMHPECAAPAAHNPLFPVNRSPLPLTAVRRMAFHDILFLHQRPAWFEQYRERYGSHYRSAAKVDPSFVRLFDSGALLAAGGSLC
ncbi:hypothetical protein JJV70_08930 [Streptomyces sp. JJ66]|uniref:DUF6875 domain-containing protein n=1 Tax=Streptomyces sp. JJ66 TaxID=2803843 RepID=UPI001C5863F2|nr:hypothetical protein [Streptomyces sp. JJ66]MBW1602232.1 hypothetical protein [Streptomyces sp. JJ66]